MKSTPSRCYTITLDVGGDTWKDAVHQLHELLREVERHGPECRMVTGGVSSGGIVNSTHNPEMTHDRYIEAIEAYNEADSESGTSA